MKNNTIKIIFSVSLFFLVIFSVFGSDIVYVRADSSVSISPSKIILSARPGESVSSSFTYTNNTNDNQKITFEIAPFALPKSGDSAPVFQEDNGKAIDSVAKRWVEFDPLDSNIVKAGGQKTVTFNFQVPLDAKGGDYYNAIFVIGNGVDKNGKVIRGTSSQINYRIGTLTTLTVAKEGGWRNQSLYDIVTNFYFLLVFVLILVLVAVILVVRRRNRAEE